MVSSLRASQAPGSLAEVVIVEDHPIVVLGLRAALLPSPEIAIVAEGTSFHDGSALAARYRPDILFLPSMLQGRSTLPIISSLRETHPYIRVLIFAVPPHTDTLRDFLFAGIWGWVVTTETPLRVRQALLSVHHGERWFSQDMMTTVLTLDIQSHVEHRLTAREEEVVTYLLRGETNAVIGQHMGLSERTVRHHLKNIFGKLGVSSRGQVIAWAVRHGRAPPANTISRSSYAYNRHRTQPPVGYDRRLLSYPPEENCRMRR